MMKQSIQILHRILLVCFYLHKSVFKSASDSTSRLTQYRGLDDEIDVQLEDHAESPSRGGTYEELKLK